MGTALTTVRPVSSWTRLINDAALTIAVGLALVDIVLGVTAFNSPRGFLNGVPFVMFFFIATVLFLAAAGDVRLIAIRRASWRAAPGAPSVADVLRPVQLRPDRSFRSVSAWRKSFPSHSRPLRCARCRSCWCLARCSTGCGGSAAAARCQSLSDTIRCPSPPARSDRYGPFAREAALMSQRPADVQVERA